MSADIPSLITLKIASDKTKKTVWGYLHRIQENVSSCIADICVCYCFKGVIFNRDIKHKYNEYIQFVDEITVKNSYSTFTSCALSPAITRNMCNIFEIEFIFKSCPTSLTGVYVGYVNDDRDIEQVDFKEGFKRDSGINYFEAPQNRFLQWLSWDNNTESQLDRIFDTSIEYIEGDTFKLEFNFIENKTTFYIKNQIITSIKLTENQIIPCVCLYWSNTTIQIHKWSAK